MRFFVEVNDSMIVFALKQIFERTDCQKLFTDILEIGTF